jgi:hypothetical protein
MFLAHFAEQTAKIVRTKKFLLHLPTFILGMCAIPYFAF